MHEHTQVSRVSASATTSSHLTAYKWRPAIDEPLRSYTLEVVHQVAERLSDPETITTIMRDTTQWVAWGPSSLSDGFGSTALLFLFLARSFPGQGWERIAQQHLRLAANDTHRIPFFTPGIFGGSCGLASTVSLFVQNDNRYRQTENILNEQLAEQVLQKQWERPENNGVADVDYDIISGASGILGYLVTLNKPGERVHAAIERLIAYLIWLARDDEEHKRKRWFLSPELYPIERHREQYPDGYFNCGLAHGIAGPLAALALAWNADYRIAGQHEAMRALARWMVEHQLHDKWGINWPGGVPLKQSHSPDEWSTLSPCRTAWCYGAPGVARALWLASIALSDMDLRQTAVEAIECVLARPIVVRGIDSVTFCHGVAGLLAICLRFAHETNSLLVRQHIPRLVRQILDGFSSSRPFGFQDLSYEGHLVEDPGLLTGAAGVALALLAASTLTEPAWDRIFLIA